MLYWKKGEYEKAIQNLDQAVLKYPEPEVYRVKGIVHQLRKEDQQAIEAYKRSLELDPESVLTHVNLGKIYLETARYKEATEEFLEVLKRKPDNYDICNNINPVFYLPLI